MMKIRRSEDRGHFNWGWLDTYHTFSFGEYRGPAHMGFRSLRVINEDYVQGGQGFGMHPHSDMEILTIVLEGELAHQDSLGHEARIAPGDIQMMSAGTGIYHSEFNPSATDRVHLLQIWIRPDQRGLEPEYQQSHIEWPEGTSRVVPVVTAEVGDSTLRIHQTARVSLGFLANGDDIAIPIRKDEGAWIQIVDGSIEVEGLSARAGDALGVEDQESIILRGVSDTRFVLFELN